MIILKNINPCELSNLNVIVALDCDTERSIEGNIFLLHGLDIYLLEQAGVGHNLVPEHDHVNKTPRLPDKIKSTFLCVDSQIHNRTYKILAVLSLYYER